MKRQFSPKTLLTAVLMLLVLVTNAAEERFIHSLNGTLIAGQASMDAQDQWYAHMGAAANTASNNYGGHFTVDQSVVDVRLRFNDENRKYYGSGWDLNVTYDIKLFYANGTGFTTKTFNGENISITFDPASPYVDFALTQYNDEAYHRAEINVTGVTLNGLGAVPDDVYLDVEVITHRFYVLDDTEAPFITNQVERISTNELEIAWSYVQGAEFYDVEWVFVDNPDVYTTHLPFDFSNATRVSVPNNHYRISLAYPRGTIVYRVRGVGFEGPNYTQRKEGPWSYDVPNGYIDQVPQSQYAGPLTAVDQHYDFNGMELDMNWQYQAVYAEDGKRKEVASFFDESLRPRQTVTIVNTDSNAVTGHAVYDFLGRAALSTLPSPTQSQGIGYYPNALPRVNDTELYSYDDFDLDGNIAAPATMHDGTLSGGAANQSAGMYYSTSNPGVGVHGDYVADAGGYPYARTTFYNDGSGRVKTSSGAGTTLGQSGNHLVKYYYGNPTGQQELDRLFGNEVGYVRQYKKNLVVDQNGQASVTYLDQSGRVIATALSGDAPDNLLEIDTRPNTVATITSDLTPFSTMVGGNWVTSNTFLVSQNQTVYTFTYALNPEDYCDGCLAACDICGYDLDIHVYDADHNEVTTTNSDLSLIMPMTNIQQTQGAITFSCTLDVGVYTVEKVLSLNQQQTTTHADNWEALQDCYEAPVIDETCDDCNTLCAEHYSFVNDDGQTVYLDDAGQITTQSAAQLLIADCQANCAAVANPPSDVCGDRLDLIQLHLKPGGQYFDNLPSMLDAQGNYSGTYLSTDVSGYNSGDINNWLNANITGLDDEASGHETVFNDVFGSSVINNWEDVRTFWDDAWLTDFPGSHTSVPFDGLQYFHPEYCIYEFYCMPTNCVEPSGTYVLMDYLDYMLDQDGTTVDFFNGSSINGTEHRFNPLDMQDITITTPQEDYQPFDDGLTSDKMDQLAACGDLQTYRDRLRDSLELWANGVTDYSIWYILADPDNVGSGHEMFQLIQDLSGPNGVITNGDITEYDLFRGSYLFYRDQIMNLMLDDEPACDFIIDADYDGQTADGFTIIYQNPELVDTYTGDSDDLIALGQSNNDDACQQSCEDAADEWMSSLGSCIAAQDQATVRQYLIDVCQLNCDGTNLIGSSEGNGGTSTVQGPGLEQFASFQDVIDYYGSGCSAIAWPATYDDYDQATCDCENWNEFLVNAELTTATDGAIAASDALNDLLTNSEEATGITAANVSAWQSACSGTPTHANLLANNFPEAFHCEADLTPDLPAAIDCDVELESFLQEQANMVFAQQLAEHRNTYVANYQTTCLSNLNAQETFTVSYELDEYHYTLFYYDQAGNLVKTVPPKGVDVLEDGELLDVNSGSNCTLTALSDVHEHRKGNTTTCGYVRPDHTMETRYTFNSLGQMIASTTPDGGTQTVWYDALGRVALSQNALQAQNNNYTFVQYDALGRPYEGGELTNTNAATYENVRTPDALSAFINTTGTKSQVSSTYYDEQVFTTAFAAGAQANLRNRVVATTFEATHDGNASSYDYATHYSYDMHGNVNVLKQELTELAVLGQSIKTLEYDYDLVSGNVNKVSYQAGKFDEYYYQYLYDGDNRLTHALSSRDNKIWQLDSKQWYYAHGALARTEIGDQQVVACDYLYTINGWLKGVNSNTLDENRDPGQDGKDNTLHQNFAVDVSGFTLGYFQGDYNSVSNNTSFEADYSNNTRLTKTKSQLYNGNIGHMVTSISDLNNQELIQAMAFEYDQLNRFKKGQVATNINVATNAWNAFTANDDYLTEVSYDANGNIEELQRNGIAAVQQTMDDFFYTYKSSTSNQLDFVFDGVSNTSYTSDLEAQSAGNYTYDAIGQLKSDAHDGVSNIEWTFDHKIKKVERNGSQLNGSYPSELEFFYDANRQRVLKIERPYDSNGNLKGQTDWKYTYYLRDASGNVMAVYDRNLQGQVGGTPNDFEDVLTAKEHHLYGGKRSGVDNESKSISASFTATAPNLPSNLEFSNVNYGVVPNDDNANGQLAAGTPWSYARRLGQKTYEVSEHRGNVINTVADRKVAIQYQTSGNVDHYVADVSSYSDYYPFGMQMPGRNGQSQDYRYGFQGEEVDNEWTGSESHVSWTYRCSDSRIGRFMSLDPLAPKYPHYSPYSFSGNKLIHRIELEGLEDVKYDTELLDPGKRYLQGKITSEELFAIWEAQAIGGAIGAGAVVVGVGLGVAGPPIFASLNTLSLQVGTTTIGGGVTVAEIANEGTALIWGFATDEEYPFPAAGDNIAQGLKYVYRQLTAEGMANLQKLKKHLGIDELTNVAVAQFKQGDEVTNLIANSGRRLEGTVGIPGDRLFATTVDKWSREWDAEVKLFETLARQLGAKSGDDVLTDVTGTLKISSELQLCKSCTGVLDQFKEMFPNITIEVSAGGQTTFVK